MSLYIYNGSNASFIKGYRFHSVITALKKVFQLALHFSRVLYVIHVRVKCAHAYIYIYMYMYGR